MKKYLMIFVVLFLLLAGGFVFLMLNKNNSQETRKQGNEINSSPDSLVVTPQVPKNKVIVKSATLSKKGFLVAREIVGNHLSQVIEISKPLSPGSHKNIEISLGSADVSKKDLVVMIYEDQGRDGVFNDLDLPLTDSNGYMTATYVRTGKQLPKSITEANPTGMMMDPNMPGMKHMVIVRYTDKGFVPDKVEVSAGSVVQFVNESSKQMWVASAPHPQHTDLPTFDQFKPYAKGGVYRYAFENKGKWGFHDHINPSVGGIVTVL